MTFLVIAVILDTGWAVAAGRLRNLLAMRGQLRNRLTGSFYLAAGLLSVQTGQSGQELGEDCSRSTGLIALPDVIKSRGTRNN